MLRPHFLVLSLGNPAPYYDTLHSAGHLALDSLQAVLGSSGEHQPAFDRTSREARKHGASSIGLKYALVQSPTQMNISGPWVAKTYREFQRKRATESVEGRSPDDATVFVLVHDDLDSPLGKVQQLDWTRSARGHNGIKSVHAQSGMKHPPTLKSGQHWTRIAVGIGRPGASRDPHDISRYVLRNITDEERCALGDTGLKILALLKEMNGC